jgi:hypothetical protein
VGGSDAPPSARLSLEQRHVRSEDMPRNGRVGKGRLGIRRGEAVRNCIVLLLLAGCIKDNDIDLCFGFHDPLDVHATDSR